MKNYFIFLAILIFSIFSTFSQGSPDYNGGYKVKFDDSGQKYFRVISWVQAQANYNMDATDDVSPMSFQLRRARVLMFSQITPKFMVLTHFGLNSLNSGSLSPTGKGDGSQLFMHDAWAQYNFSPYLSVGAGLHYFNGISRLNNQSTLNIMTLDNNRSSWSTLGLTDQFARHVGIFAKGGFEKFQYQFAINDATTNGLDSREITDVAQGTAIYRGKSLLGSKDAGKAYAGYMQYNFFDKESNFLPFKVGTYLGGKKVLNIGAGFFVHPNGVVKWDGSELKGENVSLMAVDVFYDSPLGSDGSALTGYAVYQDNNYGTDYLYSAYGSGSMLYGHLGYLLPGDKTKTRWQPYFSYANHNYDAIDDAKNRLGLGINAFMSGHNSKFTLEYNNVKWGATSTSDLNLQAMIYL